MKTRGNGFLNHEQHLTWMFQSKAREMDARDLMHSHGSAGKGQTVRPGTRREVQVQHSRPRWQERKEQRWGRKSQWGSPNPAKGSPCCRTGVTLERGAGAGWGVPARQADRYTRGNQ